MIQARFIAMTKKRNEKAQKILQIAHRLEGSLIKWRFEKLQKFYPNYIIVAGVLDSDKILRK